MEAGLLSKSKAKQIIQSFWLGKKKKKTWNKMFEMGDDVHCFPSYGFTEGNTAVYFKNQK